MFDDTIVELEEFRTKIDDCIEALQSGRKLDETQLSFISTLGIAIEVYVGDQN